MNAFGIYGFAGAPQLGMLWAGFRVPVSLEDVQVGLETQERNLGRAGVTVVKHYDEWKPFVKKWRGQVQLVMGAPPCHGFAMCNTVRGDSAGARGVNHKDNICMHKFARAAMALRPDIAAFDMVPGFISTGLPIIAELRALYAEHGYRLTIVQTQGKDLGLGQSRKRLMVIAHRVKLIVPDVESRSASTSDWISDLENQPLSSKPKKYRSAPTTTQQQWARQSFTYKPGKPWAPLLKPTVERVAEHQVNDHHWDRLIKWAVENGYNSLRQVPASVMKELRDSPRGGSPGFGGVARWNEHAPCITGGSKVYHPTQHRKLTARENARIMSYPDWYRFTEDGDKVRKAYSQVGKAVPPVMAWEAAEYLKASIDSGVRIEPSKRVVLINRVKFPHERVVLYEA